VDLLKQEKIEDVQKELKENITNIFMILQACIMILADEDQEDSVRRLVLNLLIELIEKHKYPVILALNSMNVQSILTLAFVDGMQGEVITLVHNCVELFEFDEDRLTIKHLADLYKNCLDPQMVFAQSPNPKVPDFIKIFKEIQELISQSSEMLGPNTQAEKRKAYNEELLKMLNSDFFINDAFSELECHFLCELRYNLSQIYNNLQAFEDLIKP
jgi:hypothetical protein